MLRSVPHTPVPHTPVLGFEQDNLWLYRTSGSRIHYSCTVYRVAAFYYGCTGLRRHIPTAVPDIA
eukprot:1334327-Rhodomonas_salina.2